MLAGATRLVPHSGENRYLDSVGRIARRVVARGHVTALPKNIIVLTHGWQPGQTWDPGRSYLPGIRAALEARLAAENLLSDTLVLEHGWRGAMAPSLPGVPQAAYEELWRRFGHWPGSGLGALYNFWTYVDAVDELLPAYSFSWGAAKASGRSLGAQILDVIQLGRAVDPSYDPQIHFIGHSLGTVVNAHAVKTIAAAGGAAATIEQVTILDDPILVDGYTFYNAMPRGSVEAVENLYANGWSRFGEPIVGTFPCVAGGCQGEQAPVGTEHTPLAEQFYAARVGTSQWVSPVLPGWTPPIRWNPNPSTTRFRLVRGNAFWVPVPVTGDAVEVSPGQWRLRGATASPYGTLVTTAAIGHTTFGGAVTFSPTLASLRFDYARADAGDDATLTLAFNGRALWIAEGDDFGAAGAVEIDVPHLAGQTGQLTWDLATESSSVVVTISNIQVVNTMPAAGALFTDDPLRPGETVVRAVHLAELRDRIDVVRVGLGLPDLANEYRVLRSGESTIQAADVLALRSALTQAYAAARRTPPTFSDLDLAFAPVRAVHIQELRAAVKAIE